MLNSGRDRIWHEGHLGMPLTRPAKPFHRGHARHIWVLALGIEFCLATGTRDPATSASGRCRLAQACTPPATSMRPNLFSASLMLAPTTARFWWSSSMCNRALCKNDSHSFTCVWMGVTFVLDSARFNAGPSVSPRT